MRTLTATLSAAQRSASARPYLRVRVYDRIGGVNRLAFTRQAMGSEPEGPNAAVLTAAGTLIRARADGAGNLFTQRIATPGSASAFGTWPAASGTARDVALATTVQTVAELALTTSGTIDLRESADDGVTWGSWSTVITGLAATDRIAAVFASPSVLALFFTSGATVSVAIRTAGTWGAATPWTNSVASATGLAVTYRSGGDYDLAVAGTASPSGDPKVWSCIYGDGYSYAAGTWGPLNEIASATNGSGVSFAWPSLGQPDVHRLAFVEAFAGTGAYIRPFLAQTTPTAEYAENRWREPYPFDLSQTAAHRLSLAAGTSTVWLSTPAGVWSAPMVTSPLDVTAGVLSAVFEDRPDVSTARIRLRNDDGAYANPGSGAVQQLHVGAQLEIAPGYTTSAGDEVSAGGPAYWIQSLEHDATNGRAELVILAANGWGLLDGWHARRQYAWAAGGATYAAILAFALARAGLEYTTIGVLSSVVGQQPAYTIPPGASAGNVVRAILQVLPEVALWQGSTLVLRPVASSDTSAAAYGGAGNLLLLAGVFRTTAAAANVARVTGPSLQVGEAFDFSELQRSLDRLELAHNPNLATSALLAEQATGIVRKAVVHASAGHLVAPVNCGLELYDAIAVTESRAGLSSAKRRVTGLVTTYDRRRGEYQQRVELGNP